MVFGRASRQRDRAALCGRRLCGKYGWPRGEAWRGMPAGYAAGGPQPCLRIQYFYVEDQWKRSMNLRRVLWHVLPAVSTECAVSAKTASIAHTLRAMLCLLHKRRVSWNHGVPAALDSHMSGTGARAGLWPCMHACGDITAELQLRVCPTPYLSVWYLAMAGRQESPTRRNLRLEPVSGTA